MEAKLLEKAIEITDEINASALIVIPGNQGISEIIEKRDFDFSIFVVTTPEKTYSGEQEEFKLSTKEGTDNFAKKLQDAIMMAYARGKINIGDQVVGVGGMNQESVGLTIYKVSEDPLLKSVYKSTGRVDIGVMGTIVDLAIEIGREGREGKPIGTAFIIGDSKEVLKHSSQLILNPYKGHGEGIRDIKNRENWESIKELAQLDGVFIVDENGTIEATGRYLEVEAKDLDIPDGLGSRHMASAAISKTTKAIVVSVARSGGIVRMFKDGEIIGEIDPRVRILPI
ncbi:hypothetical protein C9439_06760 [archaeon SCG-AAA382B04]|nr:hypothetical protein C9439_06760 [archaeon SCG-AAA382B04]